jgi:hypothetical protein
MNTSNTLPTEKIFSAFDAFIAQRSGIDWHNYASNGADTEGIKALRADQRTIAADGKRARTALRLAQSYPFNAQAMADALRAFSGRLELVEYRAKVTGESKHGGMPYEEMRQRLGYTTGQYFPTEYRKAAATVLEAYVEAVQPKSVPNPSQRFATIADIKAANHAAGYHWFLAQNMRAFNSRVYPELIPMGDLILFISSEQSDGPREYCIRVFNPSDASVDTLDYDTVYTSTADAVIAARAIAQKEGK